MQRIIVFEEQGSGQKKIEGVRCYGQDMEIVDVIDVGGPFPEFVEEPGDYIQVAFEADLCLNYIRHPDLSQHLVAICMERSIPVVASGQKIEGAFCPFTCCGLGRHPSLGPYGQRFGVPELVVKVDDGEVTRIEVVRGAPCGLTWKVAPKVVGLGVDEAPSTYGRLIQYECVADPSRFDPISGKSQLHYAGDVHIKALKKALGI